MSPGHCAQLVTGAAYMSLSGSSLENTWRALEAKLKSQGWPPGARRLSPAGRASGPPGLLPAGLPLVEQPPGPAALSGSPFLPSTQLGCVTGGRGVASTVEPRAQRGCPPAGCTWPPSLYRRCRVGLVCEMALGGSGEMDPSAQPRELLPSGSPPSPSGFPYLQAQGEGHVVSAVAGEAHLGVTGGKGPQGTFRQLLPHPGP